jgi:tetratricopeptide (TPR) repeat protein
MIDPETRAAILGATVLLSVCAIIVGLVVFYARRMFRYAKGNPPPRSGGRRDSTPLALWILAFVLLGLATAVGIVPHALRRSPPFLLQWGGIVFLWMAGCVALAWISRDRTRVAASRRFRAGDVEGAVGTIRSAIAERGPTAGRLNDLGSYLGLQGRWQDAYEVFFQAEKLRGRTPPLVCNQGMALWKLGRTDEGQRLIADACAQAPREPIFAGNHCLVLTDLGRIPEARQELARAERLRAWNAFLGGDRVAVSKLIEECRQKLASRL